MKIAIIGSGISGLAAAYFLHKKYSIVNDVCNAAIEIVKSIQVQDQKGTLDRFFTFDCWGAIYSVDDYQKLMADYSDMRAYNLSKANLVDDLRKSMVVDKFFNHTFRFAKTEEDNILIKAYKKIKGLFNTLVL